MKLGFYAKIAVATLCLYGVTVAGVSQAASVESNSSGVVSLKDTVAATLSYNPNIKAFQEYRQAAEFDLKRARSGWLPRVDARGGYGFDDWHNTATRAGYAKPKKGVFYDRSEGSVTISQTIWDGMATWYRVNIGENRLDSARNRLFDNAEGLGLDASLAHIEVFRQGRLVALAELNVKNHQKILASQRARQASGASTLADVTQIQSRLARTQASLSESVAAFDIAKANYLLYTGRSINAVDTPVAPGKEYPSLEVALSHAMAGNLKIKALESDVDAAINQGELDKAAFHPEVYLEAGPNYRWRVEGSNNDEWGTSVMLRANWNLFNGGYDYYNVKGSKARSRQAKQELLGLHDSLSEEVSATWAQYLSAQEQARHFASAVDYSSKTRDMYLEQFNIGQRSLLDVLDSENEVYSSSIQYVTAQQNVTAAQLRLLTLGGELLSSFDLDRTALIVRTDK